MKRKRSLPPKLSAALVFLALTAVVASTAGASSGPMAVEQSSVNGSNVQVVVHNSGSQSESGEVTVTVVVDGQMVQNNVSVSAAAGQSVGVSISFGNPIEEIQQVGIITDDAGPY